MHTRHRITGLILFALCAFVPARAQLSVTPTVSSSLGTFHYSYKVTNDSATDVSIVTLSGLFPSEDAVENLVAPDGFLAIYDPGVALLSFLEGDQPFAANSVSGAFTFDSPYAPGNGAFEAIDVNGASLIGMTAVPASPVPEPSTTAAIGGLLLVGLVVRRKFFRPKNET